MATAIVSIALPLGAAMGPPCETKITIDTDRKAVIAIARCAFTTAGVQNNAKRMEGVQTLTPGDQTTTCIGQGETQGYCGMSLTVDSYPPSTTYASNATFKAYEAIIQIDSATVTDTDTTPPAQRPRTDPPPEDIPDQPCEREGGCSPIVISLAGAYSLSGADDPVLFDIDGDGVKNRIGWTARASDDAFLAIDRNGDGMIRDGTELFGNAVASNGFEALKELDANADGRVDSSDSAWPKLLVWRDADHDGISSASELTPIETTRIRSIGADYRWTGRRDRHGNEFRYAASLEVDSDRGRVQRPVYDIFFVPVP